MAFIQPSGFFFGRIDPSDLSVIPEGWEYIIDPENFLLIRNASGEVFFVEKIEDRLQVTRAPINPSPRLHDCGRIYDRSDQRILCHWITPKNLREMVEASRDSEWIAAKDGSRRAGQPGEKE